MRLLFIRHGDPDYVIDGLTTTGRKEAELLAERIAPMDISEYYVSTMGRALETARPSSRQRGRTQLRALGLAPAGLAERSPSAGS